ncbi:hypothetical protein [Rhodococcus erythropolis]|uniref:hypothetical protein n=1 Tax=Rhodococcus erythropolis TaxID=1833 RepID=UPI001BEB11E7|nr:hypothetical protein [Rhodococcus erythropolis]MBT2266685.1 hypothetical protein [Rhodococcus erythropolis]
MAPTGSAKSMTLWTTAFVVSQANIARLLGPVAPKVLEVQTAFSARRYVEILDSMDAAETARFRSHYYPDFVHPAIYAMALRSAGTRLAERVPLSSTTRRALAVVPVLSAAGDYVENVVGLHLLDHRDGITDSRVRAASTVSIAKWVLALGTLGYLSQGFVRVWVSRK